jgi:hypothetical protein
MAGRTRHWKGTPFGHPRCTRVLRPGRQAAASERIRQRLRYYGPAPSKGPCQSVIQSKNNKTNFSDRFVNNSFVQLGHHSLFSFDSFFEIFLIQPEKVEKLRIPLRNVCIIKFKIKKIKNFYSISVLGQFVRWVECSLVTHNIITSLLHAVDTTLRLLNHPAQLSPFIIHHRIHGLTL